MTESANESIEALVRAYQHLPRDIAVTRFPVLTGVYAVEMQLVDEARNACAASEAVVEHVLDVMRGRLSRKLSKAEPIECDEALRDELRWQVAFRNLHVAVMARLADSQRSPALSAAERALLIERAEALRLHDRNRPDDVDDGVDTFRALEVAMSLALLDYPTNRTPFADEALRRAYERHLTGVAPQRLGKRGRA
jgi:hypothetical protein